MTTGAPHHDRAEVLRASGLTVGLFVAANLAGSALRPRFSTLDAWLAAPLANAPSWPGELLAAASALVLVVHGLSPLRSRALRGVAAAVLAAVALFGVADTVLFYAWVARAPWPMGVVVPAALPVALFFAVAARGLATRAFVPPPRDRRRAVVALATMASVAFALPLVQIVTSGPVRDERPADCAVVLGARVQDDGTPSDALADRVDEGVALYRRGVVTCVVMSGAVDPKNGFSEPVVMRRRAVAGGVPADAVLLDEAGVDTASTARNVSALFRERGLRRALIVTHYYHAPRTRFLFVRAGTEASSAPATMTNRLLKEPYFVVREIAAYYHSFLLE